MAPRANLRAPKLLQVPAVSSLICPAAHPAPQVFISTWRYFVAAHLVHLSEAVQAVQSVMTLQALHVLAVVSLNSTGRQDEVQSLKSLAVTWSPVQATQLMLAGALPLSPDPALQVAQSLDVADAQVAHKSVKAPAAHGQMTAVERVRARMAIATNFMITYF